jgi:dolichol-phosphate mannosyltransferase
VIVPTRNEQDSIEALLKRLRLSLPEAEVIVVDGGSDHTGDKVRALQHEWPELRYFENRDDRGKGHAVRMGVKLATQNFIAQLDSDLQFYPEDLPSMLAMLRDQDLDFVCGSRFAKNSYRQAGSVPGLRDFGNRAFSLYTSAITRQRFTDVLAGIKVWKRQVTESFEIESEDFCYEVELPIKALRFGYRVGDFSVRTNAREFGASSVNVLKTSLALLIRIPKFRWGKMQRAQ